MSPGLRYTLRFAPEVVSHLETIEKKYLRLIQDPLTEQLTFEPETQTRNRKLLEGPAPFDSTWELRFGPGNRFRVFYEVNATQKEVWILAVGTKEGNRLFIGGEEFET